MTTKLLGDGLVWNYLQSEIECPESYQGVGDERCWNCPHRSRFKGNFGNVVTRLIEPFHSFKEAGILLVSRTELNFKGQIHNKDYMPQYIYTYRRFPLRAKAQSLRRRRKKKQLNRKYAENVVGNPIPHSTVRNGITKQTQK